MSVLSKEAYINKNEYAAGRMIENAKVSTLTPGQHEALAELCKIRHAIHSMDRMSLYASESVEYDNWKYIDTANYEDLHSIISSVGLPELEWSCDSIDYPCDDDISMGIADGDPDEYAEQALIELSKLVEDWNSTVERYLAVIDKEHGTHYCPSGVTRMY